jgi:hypothetical protein
MKNLVLLGKDTDTGEINSSWYIQDGNLVFDIFPSFDDEGSVWGFSMDEAKELQLFLRRYISKYEVKP